VCKFNPGGSDAVRTFSVRAPESLDWDKYNAWGRRDSNLSFETNITVARPLQFDCLRNSARALTRLNPPPVV